MILTRGRTVVEAENYMNSEMRKILERAINNKNKFNEKIQTLCLCLAGEEGKRRR